MKQFLSASNSPVQDIERVSYVGQPPANKRYSAGRQRSMEAYFLHFTM